MRRILLVALFWCLAMGLTGRDAVADGRPCPVPDEDCAGHLDGRFTSPMDVPSVIPGILRICKRDVAIYRTCARQLSVAGRDEVLVQLAYTDDVVAEAALRLHRYNEATYYANEARLLAARLVNVHLATGYEHERMQAIAAGEPLFPVKTAFDRLMDDLEFALVFGAYIWVPVVLVVLVVALAIVARCRPAT